MCQAPTSPKTCPHRAHRPVCAAGDPAGGSGASFRRTSFRGPPGSSREGNPVVTTPFGQSTVLGYPRIGANRELKKAVEAYWAGTIDAAALERTAGGLRAEVWQT